MRRTPAGRAVDAAHRGMKSGGTSYKRMKKAIKDKRVDWIIEQVAGAGGPTKYSQKSGQSKSALDDLYDALGPFGDVLRGLFGSGAGGSTDVEDQYNTAVEVIRAFGGEVLTKKGQRGYARGVEAALELLRDAGLFAERDDVIIPTEIEPSTGGSISEPPLPGESPLSREIRTPTSSNVYSFQYDYSSSTMYVRYVAPVLNPATTTNAKGRGGMPSIKGKAGKTVIGSNRNAPGALYAYYDVPVRVFKRLQNASSAGKSVWDNLRVRGSVWGHKFRYGLIQGAVVPGQDGRISTYVSRRATRKGFKSRAVAEVGSGKRRFQTSGLPERSFPDRAQPNRGEPDRGLA